MAKTSKPINYKPIPASGDKSGYTALSIYPPGAWIGDDDLFHVFVGGGGVGTKKTLDQAKRYLKKKAIEYCSRQIDDAAKIQAHYQRERDRLFADGIGKGTRET